ncbi:histidinol dehydrogenase [Candidatus Vidania fulgoroideorum]
MFIINKKNVNKINKNTKKKIKKKINEIYKNIKFNKDKALKYYIKKYDGINYKNLITNKFKGYKIDSYEKKILKNIYNRIYIFHKKQKKIIGIKNWRMKDKLFKNISQRINNINNISIYVPGGKYCYLSTLIMNYVPAKIAGVKNIYICTPSKGECYRKICYLCNKLKIKKLYRMGGAHAIFCLSIGTKKIKKVDKIVGPGNVYVNEAKKKSYGRVGIDSLAGPTEILIIYGNKKIKNKDIYNIYSQLEHGNTSRVYILVQKKKQKKKIIEIIKHNEKFICFKNIFIIKTKNIKDSIKVSNKIAPEHLMIFCKKIKKMLKIIKNFGTIFIGKYSIEVSGDYFAGTNHVLPTNKNSKFSSPLSVNDFLKSQNIIKVNKKYSNYIYKKSYEMANLEGLKYHGLSALSLYRN